MENEIEKAIELLEDFTRNDRGLRSAFSKYGNDYDKYCEERCVAIDILLKVAEKQIPKEITINSDGYYPQCPSCKLEIGEFHKIKYCPFCGQALLWRHKMSNDIIFTSTPNCLKCKGKLVTGHIPVNCKSCDLLKDYLISLQPKKPTKKKPEPTQSERIYKMMQDGKTDRQIETLVGLKYHCANYYRVKFNKMEAKQT